jgi:GH18 family chitinase
MKLIQKTGFTFIKIFIVVFIFQLSVSAQQAKIVGYLYSGSFSYNSSISYCRITHLNVCFANPDSAGYLVIDDFSEIANRARIENPNILILVSLGGAGLNETQQQNWANLIDNPANRPEFVSKIVSFVKANNLEGVDVDLEWDDVTSGYSGFVVMLSDSLHAAGKIMTSALPATYRYSQVTNDVLEANDFINVMAYDETGPWNPDNPGQHSSYDFAVRSLNFWRNQGVPKNKLILGVPFYGFNFKGNSVITFSYAQVVSVDVKYADCDIYKNSAYYNGRPTIRKKVILASQNASGIMIWELSQDRFDEYSLLTAIHDKYTSLGYTTTGLCENALSVTQFRESDIEVYPNPSSSFVVIEGDDIQHCKIEIYNLDGTIKEVYQNGSQNNIKIDVSGFINGVYIIRISNDSFSISKKLVVF